MLNEITYQIRYNSIYDMNKYHCNGSSAAAAAAAACILLFYLLLLLCSSLTAQRLRHYLRGLQPTFVATLPLG